MIMTIEGRKARFLAAIVLCLLLLLSIRIGVHVRVRNSKILQEKYLLGFDSYRYLREAKQIAQDGHLPERDMMRYVPLGRDLREELSLNSYAIVYFHRFLQNFDSYVTVEEAAIYFPVVCFVFSALLFFLLTAELLDKYTAIFATIIFAVVPGILYRTSAGYADRDALSLFWMLLAFYFYVKAVRSPNFRKAMFYSVLSGITTGFLGLTWPGVGLIMAIIVAANFIRLITDEYEKKDACAYLFWYLPAVMMLLIFTQRYIRRLDHLALLSFGPSSIFLVTLALYFAIRRYPSWYRRMSFDNRLPLGMSLILIIFLACMLLCAFILGPVSLVTHVAGAQEYLFFPLGNNRLMRGVGELIPFTLSTWWSEYGLLFPFLLIGFVMILYELYSHYGFRTRIALPLASIVPLVTILSAVSSASVLDGHSGLSRSIYLCGLGLFAFGSLWFYLRQRRLSETVERRPLDRALVFMSVWFFILFVATHGARHFNMLFTPIAVIVAAYAVFKFIHRIANGMPKVTHILLLCTGVCMLSWLLFSMKDNLFTFALRTISFKEAAFLRLHPRLNLNLSLLIIICLPIIGSVILQRNSVKARGVVSWIAIMLVSMIIVGGIPPIAKGYVDYPLSKLALDHQWQEALDWLKEESEPDSIVAAWWDVGHWLETVAFRAAIIDNDHYIPYWIHLVARHVFMAPSESEALECLKTYGATYLLTSARNIVRQSYWISLMGSNENGDRVCFIQMFTPKNQKQSPCGFPPDKKSFETLKETYVKLIPSRRQRPRTSIEINGKIYTSDEWQLTGMRIALNNPDQPEAVALLAVEGKEIELPVREIDVRGKQYVSHAENTMPGIVVPIVSTGSCGGKEFQRVDLAFYLDKTAYKSLMVQLHMLENSKGGFELVYPNLEHPNSRIKIWKIKYPKDIAPNPAYLERTFPNKELYEMVRAVK